MMIEALKVGAKDQIKKDIELTGLGKINIICGKNNSGKSTLLSAINDRKSVSIGRKRENLKLDEYFNYLDARGVQVLHGGRVIDGQEAVNVKETIRKHILSKEFWFDVGPSFAEEVDKMTRGYNCLIDELELIKRFKENFQQEFSSLLIPNKRHLDLEKVINEYQVKATGEGILNDLFILKNKLPKTVERQKYEMVSKAFEEVSGGYNFEIEMIGITNLSLKFSDGSQNFILAKDCGLGLQDLLVILYFALLGKEKFLLIEEPETHLHPDMQRRLAIFLREKTKEKQFFFTTHSNIFLNSALVDKVFFTYFDEGVKFRDETNRAIILSELGYEVTDNLVSNLVILVEGPTDVPVLESLLMKMGVWDKYNIKFWPLGGDIMDKVDLSIFVEKYAMVAIVDRDDNNKGSKKVRKKFIEVCKKYGIYAHQLKRYAIENYFPLRILREVFKGMLDESIVNLDPNIKLEKQIGINVKNNNSKIAKLLSVDDVKGSDLYSFLLEVKQRCEKSVLFDKKKGNLGVKND